MKAMKFAECMRDAGMFLGIVMRTGEPTVFVREGRNGETRPVSAVKISDGNIIIEFGGEE